MSSRHGDILPLGMVNCRRIKGLNIGGNGLADSLITDEVRALIGTETEPERNRFAISEEMVYDLADATEDPNPLYVDPRSR